MANNLETVTKIRNILLNTDLYENFYKDAQFKDFLQLILADSTYDVKARAEIAFDNLYKILNTDKYSNAPPIIGDKEFLQKVLLSCLKEVINSEKEFNSYVHSFFSKNLEEIEENTRIIKTTQEANEIIRDLIHRNPAAYLTKYVISNYNPFGNNYFIIDPFAAYYFNNWESFEVFLSSPETHKSLSDLHKKFYEIILKAFLKFKNNSYKEFEMEPEDAEVILAYIRKS